MDHVFREIGLWEPTVADRVRAIFGRRPVVEITDDVRAILIEHFEGYLRAGGTVTWRWWSRLSVTSRACLINAAERLDAEHAARIGIATHSAEAAAEVLSLSDGGDFKIRLALEKAARKFV